MGEKTAKVLTRGLFEYAGLGISDRLSLSLEDMWVRVPAPERTMEDTFVRTIVENLGPSLSIVLGGTAAYDEYTRSGNFVRAVEKMLPTAVRSGLMAFRQQDEGVRIGGATGPLLLPKGEMERIDFVMRLLGIQPTKVAAVQRQKFAKNRIVQKLEKQRNLLLIHHYLSLFGGVDEELRVRKKIQNFNRQVMDQDIVITTSDLSRSVDARNELMKEALDVDSQGIKPKYRRQLNIPKIGGE